MPRPVPRTWIALAAATVLLATGTAATAATTKTIKVGDNWFVSPTRSPTKPVTVDKYTMVTWKWVGDSEHDIRASSVPSGEKKSRFRASERSEGTFKRKMNISGTYKLYCAIHDYDDQKMVLKVRSN